MAISYTEVFQNDLLSEEVMEWIPYKCDCGAEILFTDSLKQIFCGNPMCIFKVASRLESMAKAMKVDGWGETTCEDVCIEFNLKSPYQVFLLENAVNNGATSSVSAFNKKVAAICDRSIRRVKLWEVVKLAGIPNIETTAYKIFDGYKSLTDAYVDIEAGQVPFIAEKLGLKNADSGVMAVNIYNNLMAYKEELMFGETQFEVYEPTGDKLSIAITGAVVGFRNKSEFIKFINNRYAGKVNAMQMNSVTSDIDILITDGDSDSNKYKNAIKINQKYLEKGLETGLINPDLLGVFMNHNDLHPVGEKILITDSESLIARLDSMYK